MSKTLLLSAFLFCSFVIPQFVFAQGYHRERDETTVSTITVKTVSLLISGITTPEDANVFIANLEMHPEVHSYELKGNKCQFLIDESSGTLYEQIIAELNSVGFGIELLRVRHNQTFTQTRVEDHSVPREVKESEAQKKQ